MVKGQSRKGVLPDKPTLPPELAPLGGVLFWGMTVISCYYLVDEVGERYIVYDLEHNSNFTHDQAVAAAEHITNEGAIEAGRFVDSFCAPAPCIYEGLAELANYIEAIFEAKDNTNAYDPNEGDIPDDMLPGHPRRFRSVGDGGGSPGGFFIGRPGPGQGVATGSGNGNGNGDVTLGPCRVYGPVGFDAFGNPVWGWYEVPC
jgi:hypothetical protein